MTLPFTVLNEVRMTRYYVAMRRTAVNRLLDCWEIVETDSALEAPDLAFKQNGANSETTITLGVIELPIKKGPTRAIFTFFGPNDKDEALIGDTVFVNNEEISDKFGISALERQLISPFFKGFLTIIQVIQ